MECRPGVSPLAALLNKWFQHVRFRSSPLIAIVMTALGCERAKRTYARRPFQLTSKQSDFCDGDEHSVQLYVADFHEEDALMLLVGELFVIRMS